MPEPSAPAATERPPRQRPLTSALVLAAIACYVFALRLPIIDDAHIAMTYARTLATSGTWGMYPGHGANAATSPLNVIVLAAVGSVARSFTAAPQIVAVLCFWTVYLCAAAVGRATLGSGAFGYVALVAVAANPSVLAAVGLEGPLVAALLAAVLWAVVAGRWRLCGVLLGLLVLARMDTILLAAFVLATCRLLGAPWRRTTACFVAATLPWFLFSWVHLGSFIPDTFFLKTAQKWTTNDGFTTFADGPSAYFRVFPLASVASILLVPGIPLALFGPRVVRLAAWTLTGYAAATFIAYVLLGPPPCPWYFLQQVIPIALAGALGIAAAAQRFGRAALVAGIAPAAVLAYLLATRPLPPTEQFINVNWGTPQRYADIGRALAERTKPDEAIEAACESGTFAFYSGRYLVNEFSDQARTDDIIRVADYAGRRSASLLVAFNFLWREARPPAPVRWRLTGTACDDTRASTSNLEWDSWTRWMPHARFTLERLP